MRLHLRCYLLTFLAFLSFATACRSANPAPPAGWRTHTDPAGYSVATPPGWQVATDTRQGRIALNGTRGEKIIVWPIFIEQKQLNADGAARLVMQLARKLDASLSWSTAAAPAHTARVIARGSASQRSGSTVLTWSSSPTGTAVYVYELEAPAQVYPASAETFANILRSFRGVEDNAASQPSTRADSGPVSFTNWTDPREGAFTIQAPRGWQVVGGAYRLSATDIRESVTLASPDGQMRIFIGDASLGAFTEPNQMLAYGGLREGSYQTLGDGTRLEIRRFIPGAQFARSYAQNRLSAQCSGVQVTSGGDRPELISAFSQALREDSLTGARTTAGDAVFSCTGKNGPVHGRVFALTMLPLPGRAQLWYIYRLYGYLASPERQQAAESISRQVMNSWRVDPQWRARERQIANSAVQQDNARSQQIQARALQAIRDDQRQTSDMIVNGYNQRSKVYDEISRKRENSILGTTDVVDQSSGKQYKIDSYSDYHWMNNQGDITGNNTGSSPGYSWHELVTLP
jgi:hypothetical protein